MLLEEFTDVDGTDGTDTDNDVDGSDVSKPTDSTLLEESKNDDGAVGVGADNIGVLIVQIVSSGDPFSLSPSDNSLMKLNAKIRNFEQLKK